jgi:hypothetical protein
MEYLLFKYPIFENNEVRNLLDDEYILIKKNIRNILDKIYFNKFSGKFFTGDDEKE